MRNTNWQVKIQEIVGRLDYAIYIYYENNDGTVSLLDRLGKIEKINEGASAEPTLNLNNEMLKAFLVALDNFGIKKDEESFIYGEIEATKKHLKDMRTLLKLK